MMIDCITNEYGFSLLTTQVLVDDMPLTAVVDTGAAVSLVSPHLRECMSAEDMDMSMLCHGVDGTTDKPLFTFGIQIGTYCKLDCMGVEMASSFLGYDLVIGLDIILETGLTLMPGGEHRLAA
jgi:hypothetical protein